MTTIFDDIRKNLDSLALYILSTFKIPKARSLWVSPTMLVDDNNNNEFSSDKEIVQTKYDLELTWLLQKILNIFYKDEIIDETNKDEFFYLLAKSVIMFTESSEDYNVCDLLLAVLYQSYFILFCLENYDIIDDEVLSFPSVNYLSNYFLEKLEIKIN